MDSRGFGLLQSGRRFGTNDDGAYAYFDTERARGCILEALEMPAEMPPPRTDLPGAERALASSVCGNNLEKWLWLNRQGSRILEA
jgi:hypothetical protein